MDELTYNFLKYNWKFLQREHGNTGRAYEELKLLLQRAGVTLQDFIDEASGTLDDMVF